MKGTIYLAILVAAFPFAAARAADIGVKNGDVVVFLGDSVAEEYQAQGGDKVSFPTHVESFLAVRYPDIKASWYNLAMAGDTVEKTLGRLDRDVMPLKPTVAVICLGLEEASNSAFDDAKAAAHKDELGKLLGKLKDAGCRVYVLSPPSADEHIAQEGRPVKHNDVLRKCVDAQKLAATAASVPYLNWFERSIAAREVAMKKDAQFAFSTDGTTQSQRGLTMAAAMVLEAMNAEPIRVQIDMDWKTGTASSNVGKATGAIDAQGNRTLKLEDIPLPWPTFIAQILMRAEEWEATPWCQILLKIDGAPTPGLFMKLGEREAPVISQQVVKGHNLALYEPLRSYKPARDLGNMIRRKNMTRVHAWRDQELQPVPQPELADAQKALIAAWYKYYDGYSRLIAAAPKTFSLNAEFRQFALPTQPVRRRNPGATRPAVPPMPAPPGQAPAAEPK